MKNIEDPIEREKRIARTPITTLHPYANLYYSPPKRWMKYGLSLDRSIFFEDIETFEQAMFRHHAVANYLNDHPEVATKYKLDQTGEVSYLDILEMALKPLESDR